MEKKLKQELKAVQRKLGQSKSTSHCDNSSQSEESDNNIDTDYWLNQLSEPGGNKEEESTHTKISLLLIVLKANCYLHHNWMIKTNVGSIVSRVGSKNLFDESTKTKTIKEDLPQ